MTMDYQRFGVVDPPLSRKSSFRASLRRMGSRLGGSQTADRKQVGKPQRVPTEAAPARLPVVSLYSGPGEMRLVRRKSKRGSSGTEDGPPLKRVKTDLADLSPSSRTRVSRLLKTLGPEAYQEALQNCRKYPRIPEEKCPAPTKCPSAPLIKSKEVPQTFGRNFRKCPETVLPSKVPKRRRSLSDLTAMDEAENRPPGVYKTNHQKLKELV